MALIRFGGGVADARGSVEGQVFSKNRYGNYIRNRTTPVNPSSTRQQSVRNDLSSLVAYWSDTLTQAQRDAWDAYAAAVPVVNKLGESINLTGYNWFVGNNTAILQAGGSIVAAGPTTLSRPGTDAAFVPTVDETNQQISVAFDTGLDWVGQDGGYMLISMSQPRAAGRSYIQGPYRIAGAIDGDSGTPPTSPQVLSCPFPVAEGQKVTVQARILEDDGRSSVIFQGTVSVVA